MVFKGRLRVEDDRKLVPPCAAGPLDDVLLMLCLHMDKPCLSVGKGLEGRDAITHQAHIRSEIGFDVLSMVSGFSGPCTCR